MPKPSLAVFKFASCDGCQLSLLDCEDELLALTEKIDIVNFPEASRRMLDGPYDISLVEGSVTTEHDRQRIVKVREASAVVITIGACATAGGIQSLRNFANVADYTGLVYPNPEYIETLATSTPISSHVKVDYELHGCPINKEQLMEVLLAFAAGRKPQVLNESVCMECKARGNVCVMVAHGEPCLGPITHAGCGALCPAYARGCYGCYGVKEKAQIPQLIRWMQSEYQMSDDEVRRKLQTYNAATPDLQAVVQDIANDD